jgi:hypothetical protein
LQWQTPSRGNIEQQRIFPRLANQDDWIRFSRPYQNGLIMSEYGITGDLLSAGALLTPKIKEAKPSQ